MAKDVERVEVEALRLTNTPFGENTQPENVFKTRVGSFALGHQTRSYMVARRELTIHYFEAAFDVEIKSVWEKALFHSLELLRLDARDSVRMRLSVPFVLIYLNRDDDAFDFMRYLLQGGAGQSEEDFVRRHVRSHEGEWIYPRERNCRFLDFFQQFVLPENCNVPTSFLVAVLIIKLRLIATYDSLSRAIEVTFDTTGGQRIHVVQGVVADMLMGNSLRDLDIDSQKEQVERLFDLIDEVNPSILQSIHDPKPVLDLCFASCSLQKEVPGHVAEAFEISRYCSRCFNRVPGAKRLLEKRMDRKKYMRPNA